MKRDELDEKLSRLEHARAELLAAMVKSEEVLAALDKKIKETQQTTNRKPRRQQSTSV